MSESMAGEPGEGTDGVLGPERETRLSRTAANIAGCLLVFVVAGVLSRGISSEAESEQAGVVAAQTHPDAQLAREDLGAQVRSLAFGPSGSTLASATTAGEIWIQDVATADSYPVRPIKVTSPRSLSISNDGRILAVAGGGPAVGLIDVETREERPALEIGASAANHVAFSPRGGLLAVGGIGGHLALWDWKARRSVFTLEGHRRAITALAFSEDGSALGSGDSAGVVKIWNVSQGQESASLNAHFLSSGITSIALSPDAALLATAEPTR